MIIYIGKCYAIMLATATLIVLALATLGDATQIGLFLFMSLCQGKYKCVAVAGIIADIITLTFTNGNTALIRYQCKKQRTMKS